LLLSAISYTASAQTDSLKTKLDSFLDETQLSIDTTLDFKTYYDKLKTLDEWCYKNGHCEQLRKNNTFYDLLPTSLNDSLEYRKATMYHAHKLQKGCSDYRQALQFYMRAHYHGRPNNHKDEWSWYIENPIGNIYARFGNYDKSIYYYNICKGTLKSQKKLSRLYKNIASAYHWLGQSEQVSKYITESIKIANEKKEYKAISSGYLQLAELSLTNHDQTGFFSAMKYAKIAIAQLQSGADKQQRLASLEEIYGDKLLETDSLIYASEKIKNAIAVLNVNKSAHKRKIASLYNKLAKIRLAQKEYEECNYNLICAFSLLLEDKHITQLPIESLIYGEITFIDLLLTKARYYEKRNEINLKSIDVDSALMACDLALKVNNNIYSEIVKNTSKYNAISNDKIIYSEAIKLCHLGNQIEKGDTYLNKALGYFQKSKGKLLQENLRKLKIKSKLPLETIQKIDSLENLIISHYSGEKTIHHNLLLQNLEALEELYIENNLNRDKQNIKGPFLEYLVSKTDVFLFTNVPETKLIKLGISTENLLHQLRELNQRISKRSSIKALLQELYTQLIPIDLTKVESLTIITDNQLATLPFDILMDKEEYLIEKTILRYCYQNAEIENGKSLDVIRTLGVFPKYTNTQKQISKENQTNVTLKYVDQEKAAISENSIFQCTVIEKTNPLDLKTKLDSFDVLHFAGHSVVNTSNPYLSISGTGEDDIYANQAEYLSNDLEMVCLSACKTGLGDYKSGEGLRSLAASFLNSGSKSVVYSLWKVNDKTTAPLIGEFYNLLATGTKKDQALRRAKLKYISQATPEAKHPYYWAGLCVMGSTQPIIRKRNIATYLLSAFSITLLLLLIKRKKK